MKKYQSPSTKTSKAIEIAVMIMAWIGLTLVIGTVTWLVASVFLLYGFGISSYVYNAIIPWVAAISYLLVGLGVAMNLFK